MSRKYKKEAKFYKGLHEDTVEEMMQGFRHLNDKIEELERKLASANRAVKMQMDHIQMLNRQLEQQDKAIERKDMQFEGLKAAYKDDLINGLV